MPRKTKNGVAKRKNGRPPGSRTTVTDKVMVELFEWISDGKTVSEFCRDKKVSRTQVKGRLKEPEFSDQIAHARESGEEVIIEEMREIADNPKLVKLEQDGKMITRVHPDDVQFRKVQLWMREKMLIWSNAAKYGTKTQGDGGSSVSIVVVTGVRDGEQIKSIPHEET